MSSPRRSPACTHIGPRNTSRGVLRRVARNRPRGARSSLAAKGEGWMRAPHRKYSACGRLRRGSSLCRPSNLRLWVFVLRLEPWCPTERADVGAILSLAACEYDVQTFAAEVVVARHGQRNVDPHRLVLCSIILFHANRAVGFIWRVALAAFQYAMALEGREGHRLWRHCVGFEVVRLSGLVGGEGEALELS